MSDFTQFSAVQQTQYDASASKLLKQDYWQVSNGFRYYIGSLDSGKYVDVPHGFLTDGASVPKLFKNIVPAWGSYGQAASLHDKLCEQPYYTLEATGEQVVLTRKEIDEIFFEAMQVLEVETWRYEAIKLAIEGYRLMCHPVVPNVAASKTLIQEQYYAEYAVATGIAA